MRLINFPGPAVRQRGLVGNEPAERQLTHRLRNVRGRQQFRRTVPVTAANPASTAAGMITENLTGERCSSARTALR